MQITNTKKATTKEYAANLSTTKSDIINKIDINILVLGSSLCTKDSPGIYWPMVISFIILTLSFHYLFFNNIFNNSLLAFSTVKISSDTLKPFLFNSLIKYVT